MFKLKQKQTGKTTNGGTKDVEIKVPLKYLTNISKTFEMPVINCEINLILSWSDNCVLSNDTKATTFAITDEKCYVPIVNLPTRNNAKLLEQLKSSFKKTNNWNKYEPNVFRFLKQSTF